MHFLARRPVSFAVVLSIVLSSLAVLIPSMTKIAEAAPRTKVKYEVCHRTNAIKNPYRRISVAKSAVDDNANGHDNPSHDGPVFDVASPQATHGTTPRDSGLGGDAGGGNDRWGDIFYAEWGPSQNQRNSNNWTTAGQAIFNGATFTIAGVTKQACKTMSVKEFIESEREENPSISMQSIMNELDEMEAAEDLPLKTVLGGSFGTWFSSCTVNCEDISVITSAIEENLPRVTTEPPSNVAGTTATLNGTVAPLGTSMQWYFEWVPTTPNFADTNNAINVTPLVNANASTTSSPPQSVTANITGLTSGTTYYYRTVGLATSGSGDTLVESYTYGVVKQFNVNAPGSPTITGITCGSTTLSVAFTAPTVNAGGITAYEYSTDGGVTFVASNNGIASPITISSLTNGTAYDVVIRAKAGSVIGLDSTVTNAIPCGTPVAVTDPATPVSQQTATLHGNLTANGNPLTVTFVWGTDSTLTTGTTTTAAVPGTLPATADEYPVTLNLTGLTGSTTYYFKVVGTPTSGSAVQGTIRQFTTTAAPLPAVTTNPATSVTSTTATINGAGTSNGATSTVTFTWGTDSTLTTGNSTATASQSPLASSASGAAVTAALTGLTPSTTYYFRATITNVNGTADGVIRQFTTNAPPAPTVTTEPATSITGTTATINGTGTSNGASSTVTFTWGTDSTLASGTTTVTAPESPLATSASGTAVTTALTGLTPGTTYYFRATITNVNGTADGVIRQFTTETAQAGSVAPTTTVAAVANNDALGRVIGTAWFDINRNNRRDTGEPLLPGVDVQLTPRGVTGQSSNDVRKQSFVMKTTSAGAFDFSDLPAGTYVIKSILPGEFGIQESWDSTGNDDWEVTVTVVARQTSRGDFAAVGTALATGSVAGGGGGTLEATWSGFDQDLETDDDATFTVKLSGSGEFTAQSLPRGKYSVKATSRTGRTLASANTLQITKSGAQLSVGGLTMSVTIVTSLPQTGATGLSLPLGFAAMLIPVGIASTGLARRRRR